MSITSKPARESRLTIPRHAHPLSRLIFTLMKKTGLTYQETEFRSGVLRQTIKSWRNEKVGSLRAYEAVLGTFGYRLLPCPPLDDLPEHVRDDLEAIGLHFFSDDEALAAAVFLSTRKLHAATSYPAPLVDLKATDWECAA